MLVGVWRPQHVLDLHTLRVDVKRRSSDQCVCVLVVEQVRFSDLTDFNTLQLDGGPAVQAPLIAGEIGHIDECWAQRRTVSRTPVVIQPENAAGGAWRLV